MPVFKCLKCNCITENEDCPGCPSNCGGRHCRTAAIIHFLRPAEEGEEVQSFTRDTPPKPLTTACNPNGEKFDGAYFTTSLRGATCPDCWKSVSTGVDTKSPWLEDQGSDQNDISDQNENTDISNQNESNQSDQNEPDISEQQLDGTSWETDPENMNPRKDIEDANEKAKNPPEPIRSEESTKRSFLEYVNEGEQIANDAINRADSQNKPDQS